MTNNLKFTNFRLSSKLKTFIKENKLKIKELINQENFGMLYNIAFEYGENESTNIMSELTQLLYNINVDPLDYMDKVPISFLDSVQVDIDLILPENITDINEFAFAGSWIKSVSIPASCAYFSDYIFYDCRKLNYIYYKGTYDDFDKKIHKAKTWCSNIDSSLPVWVICTDKKVKL